MNHIRAHWRKMTNKFVGWPKIIIVASLAISPLLAIGQGYENADQILKGYKAAHLKKDVPGLMALVLFQSGGQAEKADWRNDFEAETRANVTLKVVPISEYSTMLSPEVRKRMRPTTKLVNWLVVDFPPESKSVQRANLYPIGVENGRAFIVGP
jgi:hypothetical protein